MNKPILLDLFCKAGGAGEGYRQAGFHVVSADIEPQPHNPHEFYQDDAFTVLEILNGGGIWNGYTLADIQAIHTSPHCEDYSECNLSPKGFYPRQIDAVRGPLVKTGKPYVIENVRGARKVLNNPIMLCGTMFDLPIERERYFEIGNVDMWINPPRTCDHSKAHISINGHSVWDSRLVGTPRKNGRKRPDSVPAVVGQAAMQIDWMTVREMAKAVPPAYTRWIGQFLKQYVTAKAIA